MLNAQKEKTLKDLQNLLEKKVVDRVAALIEQQGGNLQTQLNLDEAGVAKILVNLRDASTDAFQSMVNKRAGELRAELERCVKVLAEIPPLPEAEQQAVIDDLIKVLAAFLREELPPYDFKEGEFKAPAGARAPAQLTPEKVTKLEEKAVEEAKKAAAKAAEEAKKKAAEEATR
jgi:hypothetical protein